MSYVIKAVLSNAQHPEYGQVTVPFPVSDEEYDHTVEMLEPLGIGDALRQDCQVDELDSHYSVLKRLEGKNVKEIYFVNFRFIYLGLIYRIYTKRTNSIIATPTSPIPRNIVSKDTTI